MTSSMVFGVAASSSPARRPFTGPNSPPAQSRTVSGRGSIYEGAQLRGPLEDMSTPVLYTHVLCPYAQRAWLALLEKDAELRLVNIDLSSKPGWYTKLNPAGLVPAVAYAGRVQTESLDICWWADRELKGPVLAPDAQKEEIERLVKNSSKFSSAGLSYLAGTTGRSWGIGEGQTDSQRQEFIRQLQALAEQLDTSGGPFLAGKHLTLADIANYPFMERFDVAMPEFCGFDLRGAVDGKIGSWLEAMEQREPVRLSSAAPDLLLKAFRQHLSLDFFDFQTYKAASLHPQLQQSLASAS